MGNGESRTLAAGTTVAELLQALQNSAERVVVEVNLKILKRAEHQGTELRQSDTVEIVRFVGGG